MTYSRASVSRNHGRTVTWDTNQEVGTRLFRIAGRTVEVSAGESVRILRKLQELRQSRLADRTGIPRSTLSAIENGRVRLGGEWAKVLASALRCHPSVLVTSDREVDCEAEA